MEQQHYKELIERDAAKRAARKLKSPRETALATIPGRPVSHIDASFQVGDILLISGKEYVVWLVNSCRAACLPTTGEGESINISPNSQTDVVRRLGKEGAIRLLEQQRDNKSKNMSKETSRKNKDKDETAPKVGKLGGFMGHPVTAVIRCMGQLGWTFWQARKVLDDNDIQAADNTIRIQLTRGRQGDGPIAPVEKKLKGLRPPDSEKPERAAPGSAKNKGKSKEQLVQEEEEAQERRAKGRKAANEDLDEDLDEEEAPKKSKKHKEEAPKKSKKHKEEAPKKSKKHKEEAPKKSKKPAVEDEDEFPEEEEEEEEEDAPAPEGLDEDEGEEDVEG